MTEEQREAIETRILRSNLGVIVTVLASLSGIIYGYASLTSKVEILTEIVSELKTEIRTMQGNRYTSSDAVKDNSRIQDTISDLGKRVTAIERCEVFMRCQGIKS